MEGELLYKETAFVFRTRFTLCYTSESTDMPSLRTAGQQSFLNLILTFLLAREMVQVI